MAKHHYVWRKYLRAWAKDEYIYCCRNGNFFYTNLMNIAAINDFYKSKKLTIKEVEFIEALIKRQSDEYLQQLNNNWLKDFTFIHRIKQLADNKGINEQKLNAAYDKYIHNVEEELHAEIESGAIKYIESILNEDISFYNNTDDCSEFLFFICIQYMRTSNIKNRIINSLKDIMNTVPDYYKDINIENIWSIQKIICATNVSYNLFLNRNIYKMILLKHESSKEFITGDQPVFNTYADGKSYEEDIEHLELYYPISPKLAILITKRSRYNGITRVYIKEYEVSQYNQMVIDHSDTQIYATSEEVLRECGLPKL